MSVQALDVELRFEQQNTYSQKSESSERLRFYLKTVKSLWYWLTIIVSLITVVISFTVPENAYPVVYIRYFLGLIFVLLLPGYNLTRVLFPALPSPKEKRTLSLIERVTLSIGFSLALDALLGLFATVASLGISLPVIVLGLLFTTLILANVALIREYQIQTKQEL